MKIRSIQELQNAIDSELAWRKQELSIIKINVEQAKGTAQDTALRAGIALLYAHWEGSIKSLSDYYLIYVSSTRKRYKELKHNFMILSVKAELNSIISSNKPSVHNSVLSSLLKKYEEECISVYKSSTRTGGNLNPEMFSEIMAKLGLPTDAYEIYYKLIESLLEMRNNIAHGNRLATMSLDLKRFLQIYEKIYLIIEEFANQISNAAVQRQYLV